MRVAAVLLILLYGCKTVKSAEAETKLNLSSESKQSETQAITSTVQTGPETITTTVEEYGPSQAEGTEIDAGGVPSVQAPQASGGQEQGTPQRPAQAPARLIRRTVVVDKKSPALQTTRVDAQGASQTRLGEQVDAKAQSASETKPAGLFGGLLALWPLWLLGLIAIALFALWRLKPSWLAALFKLFT